ncbi:MAG: undecaprenyl-diphosphatase UppP [Fimbriimonadaceae bacterium]
MGIVEAIVLGIVQGLTEFLPVSSTAHVRVLPALLNWADPGAAFTAAIQIGTTVAVLIYFRKDLFSIALGWAKGLRNSEARQASEWRLGWGIFVGTLPIVVIGLLTKRWIENELRSLTVVAIALVGLGLLMGVAERVGRQAKTLEHLTVRDGLWVGLWQALAVVPGASRSGSTITGALLCGMERSAAARYSFLLSVPAIVAAAVFSLKEHASELLTGPLLVPMLVANLFAFASGWLAIAALLKLIQTRGLWPFVVYRVVLGALLLAMILGGRLDPFVGMAGR